MPYKTEKLLLLNWLLKRPKQWNLCSQMWLIDQIYIELCPTPTTIQTSVVLHFFLIFLHLIFSCFPNSDPLSQYEINLFLRIYSRLPCWTFFSPFRHFNLFWRCSQSWNTLGRASHYKYFPQIEKKIHVHIWNKLIMSSFWPSFNLLLLLFWPPSWSFLCLFWPPSLSWNTLGRNSQNKHFPQTKNPHSCMKQTYSFFHSFILGFKFWPSFGLLPGGSFVWRTRARARATSTLLCS